MGSTRLPGKILLPIGPRTLLEQILFRLSRLQRPCRVVIATSDLPCDVVVADYCRAKGIECFRGSETNVLERYYRCAQRYAFEQVVRLTGDNPFTDIEELDRLIDLHVERHSDFSHSFGTLPIGVGAEVFTFAALERSYRESSAPHHFEHVDEYMLENPALFQTTLLDADPNKDRPEVRLTVDTEDDYRKACFIAEHATAAYITTVEAIELCSRYA